MSAILEAALDGCIDALLSTVIDDGTRVGWLSWELDTQGSPAHLVGGRTNLYDGDAGVAWALAQLARATDRSDLADLAHRAAASALRAVDGQPFGGLLDSATGVVLAAESAGGAGGAGNALAKASTDVPATDLTSGLAGLLLAQSRSLGSRTSDAVTLLAARATRHPVGVCWADPLAIDDRAARPLLGLAHGNSGIALALAEAAFSDERTADVALPLLRDTLRWEAAWFDPIAGGWPDLRSDEAGFPTMWCHGGAGIGATRLRLLQLEDAGLDLGSVATSVRAEAEAAVQACGTELARAAASVPRFGDAALLGGLTLCHGLGASLDVLVLAAERGAPRHLEAARRFAETIVGALPADPLEWPSGVRAEGSVSLFLGVAGAAVVLARLLHPERVASPSLLA
ncbi:lanthionine synthetase LanC family protein [Lacisediminihabitans sp. H27-G8]|uniref:lanthionine synthetase LanC family protein n=1 Tax=Lacisediminihabitans sp. H27-G8 TaxID=3111909 RepID=UPI0038FC32B3